MQAHPGRQRAGPTFETLAAFTCARTVVSMSTHPSGFILLPTLSDELNRIRDAEAAIELLSQVSGRRARIERLECQCTPTAEPAGG